MSIMNNDSEEVIFEYKGYEEVPVNVTKVLCHQNITKIKACSFSNYTKLREVVLNEGIVQIGKQAFSGCSSLESITLPSTMIKIYSYAFNNCTSLRNVILNKGLREIGNSAFGGCDSLECITIPSTVDVGRHAFCYCNNLRDVALNDGIKRIEEGTFRGCTSLERITIPSSVIEIGQNVFWDCTSLRKVELHDGIETMGWDVFWGCLALDKLSIPRISTRLDNIIHTGHYPGIEVKIDEVRGPVERRGSELFITATFALNQGQNWNILIKHRLGHIIDWIRYYEIKEATILFELALWKSNLDQAEEANDINREAYRIDVPGPVKDSILQYL